jgi:molybdopterin-binding protein
MLRKLRDVAKEIGISYPTLKQWIYRGQVRTVRTVGGHHRVPDEELTRLLGKKRALARMVRRQQERSVPSVTSRHRGLKKQAPRFPQDTKISGRNKIAGFVQEIEFDGLLARVVLAVGRQAITAIITKEACLELDLQVGDNASALIKATEVMILK